MKRIAFAAATIIVSLALLISGCGAPTPEPTPTPLPPTPTAVPPTPTPEVEPNYTNASLGLSIWYPEDWVYEESISFLYYEEEQVTFATSEEFLSGAVLLFAGGYGEAETGAGMLIMVNDLEEIREEQGGVMGIRDQFILWSMSLFSDVNVSRRGIEGSELQYRKIGEQEAIITTFEWAPEDNQVGTRGFLAVTEYKDWAYIFVGVSLLNERREYAPVMEAMLDSVEFIERE